jgi:hypothetical protein
LRKRLIHLTLIALRAQRQHCKSKSVSLPAGHRLGNFVRHLLARLGARRKRNL